MKISFRIGLILALACLLVFQFAGCASQSTNNALSGDHEAPAAEEATPAEAEPAPAEPPKEEPPAEKVEPPAEKVEPPAVQEEKPVEEAAPAPEEEKGLVFYQTDIDGYKIDMDVYSDHTDFTCPEEIDQNELDSIAKTIGSTYPEYKVGILHQGLGQGKVAVFYPEGLANDEVETLLEAMKTDLEYIINKLAEVSSEEAPVQVAEEPAPAEEKAAYPYQVVPVAKDASGADDFYLYIVHTNDVQGRVREGEGGGIGYANLAGLVEWGRGLTPDILLLDAGNVLTGTSFAAQDEGGKVGVILDKLGYDAVSPAIGDFAYGPDKLVEYSKASDIKVLCANALEDGTYLLFQPYQIYDFNGFKVAVIGLTDPGAEKVEGLGFKDDIVFENAQKAIDMAHEVADYVVVLGHVGLDALTSDVICSNINGIDLFVDGDSGAESGRIVNGARIVHADGCLRSVGVVEIHVKDGKVEETNSLNVEASDILDPEHSSLARFYNVTAVEPDKDIAAFIDDAVAGMEDEVVARAPVRLDGGHVRTKQTNLSRLVCRAMTAESGAQFSIINGGSIKASIAKGDMTVGDVSKVVPSTDTLAVVKITGNQIYDAFEKSHENYPEPSDGFCLTDLQVVYNALSPKGGRIIKIFVGGKAIEKDGTSYECATNDWGRRNLGDVQIVSEGRMLNEVFIDYLKKEYPPIR